VVAEIEAARIADEATAAAAKAAVPKKLKKQATGN
jgi:hypothetical protein